MNINKYDRGSNLIMYIKLTDEVNGLSNENNSLKLKKIAKIIEERNFI